MKQVSGLPHPLSGRLEDAVASCNSAVSDYRQIDTLNSAERRRLNELMDDLICATEAVKIAHQRLLERTSGQVPMMASVPPGR